MPYEAGKFKFRIRGGGGGDFVGELKDEYEAGKLKFILV
jgi:hypothetical protein